MNQRKWTIWTNAKLPAEAAKKLDESVLPHRLVYASEMSSLNLKASPPDLQLAEADIAFGQPDAEQIMLAANLRWIHLTTAGYTPYDRDDLRAVLQARNASMTTSSGVYDEPCAQHILAMMLAFARQLPNSISTQFTDRSWPAVDRRRKSFLLNGQTALICGYGEIAVRLCELLAPFQMKLIGVRRTARGTESIPMIDESRIQDYLPIADHVINLLPANSSTIQYFDARKIKRLKWGAYFYNIGRGTTVDQDYLETALRMGSLGGAYLDVMTPEPLAASHSLWTAPNCYLTPHSAGGYEHEMTGLVDHFVSNLNRFSSGSQLVNRIV
jgi:phosphoglycerate dehydrogenase-like enzyme